MSTASPQGVRAVDYFLHQMYEGARGVVAAYVVDTGDSEGAPIEAPTWENLTGIQRAAFMAHAYPVFEILANALTAAIEIGEQP